MNLVCLSEGAILKSSFSEREGKRVCRGKKNPMGIISKNEISAPRNGIRAVVHFSTDISRDILSEPVETKSVEPRNRVNASDVLRFLISERSFGGN